PYAIKIARDWNTKNEMRAGYVTEFEVEDAYVSRFEPHIVGSREHEELWIPAEELAQFNIHIVGKIRVIEAYVGEGFTGLIGEETNFTGRDAREQFIMLEDLSSHWQTDLGYEMWHQRLHIFLHFPFWMQHDFTGFGISDKWRYDILTIVRNMYHRFFPDIWLCYEDYL
ncbi:MAG TPA: hypothetical protein VH393_08265, partial [Ktedonobacterales bacterium]